MILQFTGLSASGKTTIANEIAKWMKGVLKIPIHIFDGDIYRKELCKDLGFSEKDRKTNIERLGFVANVMRSYGIFCIIAAINPYEKTRQELQKKYNARIIYIECTLDECFRRDPKGLYKRTTLPDNSMSYIPNFTGISAPYEKPQNPDLILNTEANNLETCLAELQRYILKPDKIDKR